MIAPAPKPPPRTEILDMSKMERLKLVQPKQVIDGLLTTLGLWLTIGAQKTGKTILAVQLALDYHAGNTSCSNYRMLESRSTCYHPLLLFNRKATAWRGNVHSAEDWEELLLPEIERQQQRGKEVGAGRPCLCQARDLRGARRAGCKLRHLHSGQASRRQASCIRR